MKVFKKVECRFLCFKTFFFITDTVRQNRMQFWSLASFQSLPTIRLELDDAPLGQALFGAPFYYVTNKNVRYAKNVARINTLAYANSTSVTRKNFQEIGDCTQCYITIYVALVNALEHIISYSVCHSNIFNLVQFLRARLQRWVC